MNNELKLDARNIKVLYLTFRYSPYYPIAVPSAIIFICLLAVWIFLVPQIQSWFSLRGEIDATQQRIRTIKNNINFMQLLNGEAVDSDYQIATNALPAEKDFTGILTAISNAAASSGLQLQDYSFSLGTVSRKEDTVPAPNIDPAAPPVPNIPVEEMNSLTPINLGITVEGTMANITAFTQALEKKIPLSQVRGVQFSDERAQIDIAFYTKRLPDFQMDTSSPVNVLTEEDKQLLQELRSW